jgi:uncharacterized OB-fold protein
VGPVAQSAHGDALRRGLAQSPLAFFFLKRPQHKYRLSARLRAPRLVIDPAACSFLFIPSGDIVLETSHPLWSAGAEPALLASRDRRTDELVFPAVAQASPLHAAHETVAVAAIGEVYSYTVIHPSPKSGQPPHALGYVDFPGPVRIFGRLCSRTRPAIGERYRAQPDDEFGYVFVAVEA